MASGADGRDHNPFGFSMWLAGGGTKGGTVLGETDEFGYHAIKDKVEIYDLHATALHLLGFDYKKLTYRFGGARHAADRRPRRGGGEGSSGVTGEFTPQGRGCVTIHLRSRPCGRRVLAVRPRLSIGL